MVTVSYSNDSGNISNHSRNRVLVRAGSCSKELDLELAPPALSVIL